MVQILKLCRDLGDLYINMEISELNLALISLLNMSQLVCYVLYLRPGKKHLVLCYSTGVQVKRHPLYLFHNKTLSSTAH